MSTAAQQTETFDDVDQLIFELRKVGRGRSFVAWELGGALASFDRMFPARDLTLQERDSLMVALTMAWAATDRAISQEFDRVALKNGIFGAVVRTISASESPEQQSQRHPSSLRLAAIDVRILRNLLHNEDLKIQRAGLVREASPFPSPTGIET
ncbi:MAG: hypothetical protein WBA44_00035 [Mesorhizobium sp.]